MDVFFSTMAQYIQRRNSGTNDPYGCNYNLDAYGGEPRAGWQQGYQGPRRQVDPDNAEESVNPECVLADGTPFYNNIEMEGGDGGGPLPFYTHPQLYINDGTGVFERDHTSALVQKAITSMAHCFYFCLVRTI